MKGGTTLGSASGILVTNQDKDFIIFQKVEEDEGFYSSNPLKIFCF
jgi:hypothetical protein